MSSSLVITGVRKAFGKKVVLENLSFEAKPGEFIVLVGPSGCGKSTMLRAIAGLEPIDTGTIVIGDRDVTNLVPKDRDIAMVFQDYALYPHKNVYENIAFGLRIRGIDKGEIDHRVQEAATKLDLVPLLERKPSQLSGGQRQRVAIGRAIVRKPKAFLFDEPLSNLDAKLRGSMRLTIGRLHKELKATIVYVTHDQVEAMTLADRIIVLHGGVIQQVGSPLDLYYHPANVFVATFIGSPTMNLIDGRLEDQGGAVTFKAANGLELKLGEATSSHLKKRGRTSGEVVWGVRPENLRSLEGTPEKDCQGVFDADVIVTETLGPSSVVLCTVCGHEMQVNLAAPFRPTPGDRIKLEFRSKHLFLFDKESGLSLME